MSQQAVGQAVRSAMEAQAAPRKERVDRERRLEGLAVEVLTALGERDATIAATEQRAGAALQAMITDEHLTVGDSAIDDDAGDRTYLVLARPNVIMNDIRLRGLAVAGSQPPVARAPQQRGDLTEP
jgi:hypothetical protein